MGVEVPTSSGSDTEGKCKKNQGKAGNWWNNQRAITVSQSAEVIEAAPGETVTMSFTFKNNTKAPWYEKESYLSFANCHKDEKNTEFAMVDELPIQMVKHLIEEGPSAETEQTIHVPITVAEHAVADDKLWNIRLKFRGPGGNQFGQGFNFTLRVKFPEQQRPSEETSQPKEEVTKMGEFELIKDPEVNFYKTALKLHELTSVSFDEVCKVLKQVNCDEKAATEVLQRKE